jgi:hypothetical protein
MSPLALRRDIRWRDGETNTLLAVKSSNGKTGDRLATPACHPAGKTFAVEVF